MGTRSTYRIIEQYKNNKTEKTQNHKLALVYFQFDGYPSGHPLDTAKWLASDKVVNGIGMDDNGLIFNGAGCLAAQFIEHNKSGAGGVYVHRMTSRGHSGEDYSYDIIVKEDKTIEMIAYDVSGGWGNEKLRFKKIFQGTPSEFISKYEKE